jgi:hypothetical protein
MDLTIASHRAQTNMKKALDLSYQTRVKSMRSLLLTHRRKMTQNLLNGKTLTTQKEKY